MWVVKLGGSLAIDPVLRDWLDVLATHGRGRVVIVPGGGPFADQVRDAQESWGFPDDVAHRMALHAMEQFALMLLGLAPRLVPAATEEDVRRVLQTAGVAVWLPVAMTIAEDEIPPSWEVTSDSLAAWLAQRLNAERLILVKSVPLPRPDLEPAELSRLGIVDAAFPEFAARTCVTPLVLSKEDHQTLRAWLVDSRLVD